jgi:creatinine amidohydrolase
MNHFLPTATTSDEKERGAKCAVLPVGSFEQHGDYLPLITDTVRLMRNPPITSEWIAARIV